MSKFWFNFPLPLAALYITAVCLNHAALAVQVTSSGPQTLKKAQEESVTLGCTYSLDASDVGDLDIEWTRVSQDMTQKDELILSYTGGKQYQLGSPDLMSRLKFAGDPSLGDATVSVSSVKVSDTATYQCKVKKAPGVDSRKVTLVVLVRPSPPKCWVEGSEEKGGTVSLRCKSSQGSSPLKYAWTKESGNLPPTAAQNPQTGELLIRNHSDSYTGRYLCEVSNEVGTERCTYALQAYNRRMLQLLIVAREAVTPASALYLIITAIRGSITAQLAKPMSHGPDPVAAVPTPNAAESKGKPACLHLITGLRSDMTADMDTPYNHRRPARGHGNEKIKLTQKMQYCARP
uniref:V-set and immunoglobulin domain containing 8b n=1 Tax=Cyprinus carpio carpio TaxID=630221 RepID=A0A8C0YIB9_CYPCA